MEESIWQSWHTVGPQQMVVIDVLLLLKYLTKFKCRMKSMCVQWPKVLSLVLMESPGQWCLFFFKSESLCRTECGPLPQKGAHSKKKFICHFRNWGSLLVSPGYDGVTCAGKPEGECKLPALCDTQLYAQQPRTAMRSWTDYVLSASYCF